MDMAQFYGSFWVPWCSTETSCNGVVGIGCSGSSQLLQSWWMDQCSEPGQITEITELRLHMSRYSVTQRIAAEWTPITSNNCTAHILLAAWQREVLGILVELVPQPANCRDWRGVSYPVLGDLHQSPTPVNDLSIGNVERCLNFKDLQGIFLESKDVYGYLRDNPIHICNLWQRSKKTWRKTKWNNWNNQEVAKSEFQSSTRVKWSIKSHTLW